MRIQSFMVVIAIISVVIAMTVVFMTREAENGRNPSPKVWKILSLLVGSMTILVAIVMLQYTTGIAYWVVIIVIVLVAIAVLKY